MIMLGPQSLQTLDSCFGILKEVGPYLHELWMHLSGLRQVLGVDPGRRYVGKDCLVQRMGESLYPQHNMSVRCHIRLPFPEAAAEMAM